MQTKQRHLWEIIHTSFWFKPALMIAGAIALAFAMLAIDAKVELQDGSGWRAIIAVDANGARDILTMIAQSLINVTTLAFSITIVVLTLASSQFGPRLLRNFIADGGNHLVLGAFTSTFVYCLLVLWIVPPEGEQTQVPSLSVSLSVVMAIVNVGILIYFIHHIATSIQVDHVINNVRNDLEKHIEYMFPEQWDEDDSRCEAITVDENFFNDGQAILATRSGYLQAIDKSSLMELACAQDFIIRLRSHPGDFVITGTVLMTVKYPGNTCDENLKQNLIRCFYLGSQRTPEQDPGFAIRQMAEIAVRALSPSLNDPFTAMICIDQLSAVLCSLAQRKFPASVSCDNQGHIRLVETPVTFPDLLNAAFDLIRQYGRNTTSVTIRLLKALKTIAEQTTNDEQREAILRQATMIEHGSYSAVTEANDRREAEHHFKAVLQALARAAKSRRPISSSTLPCLDT